MFHSGDGDDVVWHFEDAADIFDLTEVAGVHGIDDLVLTDTGQGVMVDYVSGTIFVANVGDPSTIDFADFVFA